MMTEMQSGIGLDPHARGDPKNYSFDATCEKNLYIELREVGKPQVNDSENRNVRKSRREGS